MLNSETKSKDVVIRRVSNRVKNMQKGRQFPPEQQKKYLKPAISLCALGNKIPFEMPFAQAPTPPIRNDVKFKSMYDHQMTPETEYVSNLDTNSTGESSYKDVAPPMMRVSVIKKMPKKETSPFKNQRL